MTNRGRPKTFKNTEALEKAMELFWTNGYEGASLNELIEVMGISRQSMYNTFGNKHALFIKCVDHYMNFQIEEMSSFFSSNGNAKEKLTALFNKLEGYFLDGNTKGCMISSVIQEMALKDDQVKKLLETKYSKNFESFHKFFQQAFENNEIKSELSAAELADLIDAMLLSMTSLCKIPNRENQISNLITIFLKQIEFES